MFLSPYLMFNGTCEEAFKFYEQCLDGKIGMMVPHKGTPAAAQTPPEWHDKIMHARMTVGASELMGSDAPPGHFKTPQGFSLSLNFKDTAEAGRIFKLLSEGGQVQMPFAKTFWSPGFAMFADKFGIAWMINCEPQIPA